MADIHLRDPRWSIETEKALAEAVARMENREPYYVVDMAAARVVLAHLADSGRLLPDGGVTQTVWAPFNGDKPLWTTGSTETYAREKLPHVQRWCPDAHLRRRMVTTWPDGREYRTPWEPAESPDGAQ